MAIKLSICIPTYNRADYLPIAIDSVLEQMSDRVEIVICDNGSVDPTPEVAARYCQKHPQIRYFRFEQNVGPDRCFLKSIEIATGEYGWFLGDDDAIEMGSIKTALKMLDQHQGVTGISVNRKTYDSSFQKELSWGPIYPGLLDDRVYRGSKQCIHELFTYFGYMSGQICSREKWQEVVQSTANIERFFNAYSILAIVVKMIQRNPYWIYSHHAIVKYRSDNDSFAKELGHYKRFLLDAVGYESLARDLLGPYTPLYRSCLGQIARTHIQARLVMIKENKMIKRFVPKAFFVLLPRYFATGSFWLYNCPVLLMPRFLIPLARNIFRFGRKFFSALRLSR
ncbi:MAG TPA: glycosyltransferase family 2 protein [Chlamydiales bacterium]|nr:glycosyltransferase family 2 protein [Chlamydiales bacterium]